MNGRRAAGDDDPVKICQIGRKLILMHLEGGAAPIGPNRLDHRRKFLAIQRVAMRKGRQVGVGDKDRKLHDRFHLTQAGECFCIIHMLINAKREAC